MLSCLTSARWTVDKSILTRFPRHGMSRYLILTFLSNWVLCSLIGLHYNDKYWEYSGVFQSIPKVVCAWAISFFRIGKIHNVIKYDNENSNHSSSIQRNSTPYFSFVH